MPIDNWWSSHALFLFSFPLTCQLWVVGVISCIQIVWPAQLVLIDFEWLVLMVLIVQRPCLQATLQRCDGNGGPPISKKISHPPFHFEPGTPSHTADGLPVNHDNHRHRGLGWGDCGDVFPSWWKIQLIWPYASPLTRSDFHPTPQKQRSQSMRACSTSTRRHGLSLPLLLLEWGNMETVVHTLWS